MGIMHEEMVNFRRNRDTLKKILRVLVPLWWQKPLLHIQGMLNPHTQQANYVSPHWLQLKTLDKIQSTVTQRRWKVNKRRQILVKRKTWRSVYTEMNFLSHGFASRVSPITKQHGGFSPHRKPIVLGSGTRKWAPWGLEGVSIPEWRELKKDLLFWAWNYIMSQAHLER